MEPLGVAVVLGLVVVAGSAGARLWRERFVKKMLQSLLGFEPEEQSLYWSKMTGTVDGLHVEIDFSPVRAKERLGLFRSLKGFLLVVEVWDTNAPVRYLSLMPGNGASHRISTGDSAFDDVLSAQGKEPEVRSRLNESARAALRGLISSRCTMDTGRVLVASTPLFQPDPFEALKNDMMTAISVYRQVFESEKSMDLRLATIALHDPVGEVRFRALHLLLESNSSADTARAVIWDALADVNHDCVALAASHLAALVEHADHDREKLAAAVARCESHWDHWPGWRNAPLVLLARTLRHVDTQTRQKTLIRMLKLDEVEHSIGPETEAGATSAVDRLIRSRPRDVALTAIETLESVGEVVAVEYLKPLTTGIFSDSKLSRSARKTIDAIQGRVSGAALGQLSLSDDETGGEVSLVELSKGGELELTDSPSDDDGTV